MIARLIRIEGHVQGVGYRYFAYRLALRFGVKGYVKNLPDGSVEIHAEGSEVNVSSFVKEVVRGPISAVVVNVNIKEVTSRGFKSFEIAL